MNAQAARSLEHGREAVWPELDYSAWHDTRETLHRWLQIVGKVRLGLSPPVNHSWQATFYVTARGLTTSPMFYGARLLEVEFDFIDHKLAITSSDGQRAGFSLEALSVAEFHERFFRELAGIGISTKIYAKPNEIADATPFTEDTRHRAYDPDYAARFWRVLAQSHRVLLEFRSRFIGKCSPVHLFWGALDLAVTRFSGRRAPPHPGGVPNLPDRITREAYSHEVSSCGFWPGGGAVEEPAFYSYAYPEPQGYSDALVTPQEAYYSSSFREFILPYDVVRKAESPDKTLLGFFQSSYEAAARLGWWQRGALERELKQTD